MARLLSFMRVILCIAVTLDVGVSARNLARLDKSNYPTRQTSELSPHREERNLGGLSLLNNLPKPDLSKYGLPPLPDLSQIFNLPKELASGGSATPNARNLGGLSGMPKPDLSKFGLPPLPDLPNLFGLVKQLGLGGSAMPKARNLGGLPKLPELPDIQIDLPFGLPELPKVKLPFGIQKPDLATFLSKIYAMKLDYEDMKIMEKYRQQEEEEVSPAPAPAPAAKKQPIASPPVNNGGQQQMPKQNPSSQQPGNQGIPSMNPGGQQPQQQKPIFQVMPGGNLGGMQNHVMPNRPSNVPGQPTNKGISVDIMPSDMIGQPMNQGKPNPMQPQSVQNGASNMHGQPMNPGITHFMKYSMPNNMPLDTPGQPINRGPPPLREGNERPDPMRRRLY